MNREEIINLLSLPENEELKNYVYMRIAGAYNWSFKTALEKHNLYDLEMYIRFYREDQESACIKCAHLKQTVDGRFCDARSGFIISPRKECDLLKVKL